MVSWGTRRGRRARAADSGPLASAPPSAAESEILSRTLRDLISGSAGAVFGIDVGQSIVFWNRPCESITKIPPGKAIGSRCDKLVRGRELMGRPICKCDCPPAALAKDAPPPSRYPVHITRLDGQAVQINVGSMPIPCWSHRGQWKGVRVMPRGPQSRTQALLGGEGRKKTGLSLASLLEAFCQRSSHNTARSSISYDREVCDCWLTGPGSVPGRGSPILASSPCAFILGA